MLLPWMRRKSIKQYDYVVHQKDEQTKITTIDRLEYAFLERNRCKKNTLVVHTGLSSEGKSTASLNIVDKILEKNGYNFLDYMDDIIVYTPFEFPQKFNNILYEERLKNIPFLVVDDARFVISAKKWQSFLNQAISEVLSVSRAKKALTIFFNTQFLKDLDKDIRLLLNFWGECTRPLHQPTKVKYTTFYHDTRDPENIKVRKRKMKGLLVLADGRRIVDMPSNFIFSKLRPELLHLYEKKSFEAKGTLIKKRTEAMLEEMKKELGLSNRIDALVEFYSKPERAEELTLFFDYKYRKVRVKEEAYNILGLTSEEAQEFQRRVESKLKSYFEEQRKKLSFDVEKDEVTSNEQ